MPNLYDFIEKTNKKLAKIIEFSSWLGVVSIGILIILVSANVFARLLIKRPLSGTVEGVELMMISIVFLALSYTEKQNGHVNVTIIVSKFPIRAQKILSIFLNLLSAVFFMTVSWQGLILTRDYLFPTVRATDIMKIPFAPFLIILTIGLFLLGLQILTNTFWQNLKKRPKKEQ